MFLRSASRAVACALLLLWVAACEEHGAAITEMSPQASARHHSATGSEPVSLRLYKSPTCGCCNDWVTHVESAGLTTHTEHPVDLQAIKSQYGIAPHVQSCHTAVSHEGYVFEGHVPARFIRQFLDSPPADALGLAVPGMPLGSPGMEVDDRWTPYQVLLLKADGSTEVYARIDEPAQQYHEGAQP